MFEQNIAAWGIVFWFANDRSRGERGDCRDPFVAPEQPEERVAVSRAVAEIPCSTGWCSKVSLLYIMLQLGARSSVNEEYTFSQVQRDKVQCKYKSVVLICCWGLFSCAATLYLIPIRFFFVYIFSIYKHVVLQTQPDVTKHNQTQSEQNLPNQAKTN